MENIKVVGLGALNMDHLYRVERLLDDGETAVREALSSPGGSAANTIYGLARLGVKTGFAGVVGDDAEGRIMLDDFEQAGVDTSRIRVKAGARTGASFCLIDRRGGRSLYISSGANDLLTAADLDEEYLSQAEILHISSFADDRQFKVLLGLVKKLAPSVKVSFAPGALFATRGLKALAPLLRRTHTLFLNRSEVRQLTGQGIAAGAKTLLEQGCRTVAVTLGRGARVKSVTASAYVRDAAGEYILEPALKEAGAVLDTTGAGDAFAAGFLFGLLRGKTPGECGRIGDIAARLSVTQMGARPGLPTLDELSRLCSRLNIAL